MHRQITAQRVFCVISAFVLFLTGLAKVGSAFGPAFYLQLRDPLFTFLTNRSLFAVTGALEICACIYLLAAKNYDSKVVLIAAVATLFLGYRLALIFMHVRGPCKCLGGALDWLDLDEQSIHVITLGLLGFLLIPSYSLALLNILNKIRSTTTNR